MKSLRLNLVALTAAAVLAAGIGVALYASFAQAAPGGPTVTLSSSSATTTNASSVSVTATFSEGVTGFSAGDITAASSTVSNFASTSASVYTFTLTPAGQGSFSATVPADVSSSTASTTLGNQSSNTLSFTSDTTGASISNVAVATTSSTATITWTTNESTTGTLQYGTTTTYGASTTVASVGGTGHTGSITGLSPSTTYFFRIEATDAAGNMASSTGSFTTSAAPLAPTISNITVSNISSTTATISWSTDIPSTGSVEYGLTTSYGSSANSTTTASTSQSVSLTGLQDGKVYHFRINANNALGTATTTSADQTFVTQSTASSTPLAVTGIDTVSSTATADNTYANGWKWTMHLTVPDNEDAFRMKFSDWTGSAGTFATANNVRIYSAQFIGASTQGTALTSTNTSYGQWAYLTGDASATTPGRQIDVTIEVKIPVGTPAGSYTTTFGAQSTPSTATSTASI